MVDAPECTKVGCHNDATHRGPRDGVQRFLYHCDDHADADDRVVA